MSTLDELMVTANAIADCLHEIHEQLPRSAEQPSSVEVATSTRGYDIKVKCYAGSPVEEAGNAAVAEYLRVRQMIENGLVGKA